MITPLFKCKIEFHFSPHLFQVYDGFCKLSKKGIIKLDVIKVKKNITKPIIKVIVDNKYTVIYDTLDGFNWKEGSLEDNLSYFEKEYSNVDYYFKRSYCELLKDKIKNGKIFPLGLNYSFDFEKKYLLPLKEEVRYVFRKYIKKNILKPIDFEYPPCKNPSDKILFLTRLWNPDEIEDDSIKAQRELINKRRIEFIKICKSEFGSLFTGGIQADDFSIKIAKDIIVSNKITNKRTFLKYIKNHNICIATTGLHNSIGWKFAEYVAGSRAIVSEPLHFILPGNFKESVNYLAFNNSMELIDNIYSFLKNSDMMIHMMKQNYEYYNNYVDSEKMILNTLLIIHNG